MTINTQVMNLCTCETITYHCNPLQAVVAAYAQSCGDWNTWEYQTRYAHLATYGEHTVACCDWCAMLAYEDELPDMTDDEYARWHDLSFVLDGVRVGYTLTR
jgi:hypothetical protein